MGGIRVELIKILGAIAGAAMPLFNIPLIMKIHKRKSSKDISIIWCMGVWACILLMTPSSIMSDDFVLKAFGISNVVFFTVVVFFVFKYRKEESLEA